MDSSTIRYARSENIDVSRVGERVILYQRDTGKALVLNPSGSWLWEQLSTPQTGQGLTDVLQNHFASLSPAQAAQDVEAFLNELHEHGAITNSTS